MKKLTAKLMSFDEKDSNEREFSKDCKIDFSRVKMCGIFTHDFNQKPIGRFGDIIEKPDGIYIQAIMPINEDTKDIIKTGLKSGLLRLAPSGEVKYNNQGDISEFRIYEISICSNHEKPEATS